MVYTASSLALAALEVLVHLPPAMRRTGGLPAMTAVAIDVPDHEIAQLSQSSNDRDHGDIWAATGTSLALRVPSRVIEFEVIILINPRHPKVLLVTVISQIAFLFDDRLRH